VSNLEKHPAELECATAAAERPVVELLEGRDVVLGGTRAMGTDGLAVVRTLPNKTRRMVGAWCFVDHYGYADEGSPASMGTNMRVPPHPHTGLQTVTWLLEGEVHHRDSLGSDRLIHPGQLNLMTAGRAIAHAETSPQPGPLHGVQLWVALPDGSRGVDPHFEHHATLPALEDGVTVLMGQLGDIASDARTYSPLVGAQATVTGERILPLEPSFEHALLALHGRVEVEGVALDPGPLLYLGRGRKSLRLHGNGEVLLLGGEPFDEEIIMWWNFIGRTHEEIVEDREDWMAGRRFGPVVGYDGEPLPAPEMPLTTLKPRGRTR
jgi:quercetin 2,3-dioxygenase